MKQHYPIYPMKDTKYYRWAGWFPWAAVRERYYSGWAPDWDRQNTTKILTLVDTLAAQTKDELLHEALDIYRAKQQRLLDGYLERVAEFERQIGSRKHEVREAVTDWMREFIRWRIERAMNITRGEIPDTIYHSILMSLVKSNEWMNLHSTAWEYASNKDIWWQNHASRIGGLLKVIDERIILPKLQPYIDGRRIGSRLNRIKRREAKRGQQRSDTTCGSAVYAE